MRTYRQIDISLIRWAESIQRDIDASAYAKTSILYRMMRHGPDGAIIHTTQMQVPNYWPDDEIRSVNEAINTANINYRNAIILTFILKCSLSEAGKQTNLTKDQFRHLLSSAKKYIQDHVSLTQRTETLNCDKCNN